MAQKPSIPKGTRDFSPIETRRRNYIFDTIKRIFSLHGFSAIETPAMENLSTLMGKYGEEGDKLLFKILNSGNFSEGVDVRADYKKLLLQISEKGLRYDLTVPFARYVVQHQNDITFPFKRSQIQPVWRADRPQKGRYREFYQCDADVIGSNSLLNEADLVAMVDEVFAALEISVLVKINNRKILYGIAETVGYADKMIDITVAIDKLEKIGLENVNKELETKGLSCEAIEKLQPILHLQGNTETKLQSLKAFLAFSEQGKMGIEEIEELFSYLKALDLTCAWELDLTLARGLNYYTGAIFEVKAKELSMGSICGGGRYDDLTGIFGLKDVSGVGISFGADRIYDVLQELDKFPSDTEESTDLLFVNFGKEATALILPILSKLRQAGVSAEYYPDSIKLAKQFSYADSKKIPYVAVVGENELKSGRWLVKEMQTGNQKELSMDDLIKEMIKIK